MKFEIKINDIAAVPEVIIDGVQVKNIVRVNFNWETSTADKETESSIELKYATGVEEDLTPKIVVIGEKTL